MNNQEFYDSFVFRLHSFNKGHDTDNFIPAGIPENFVAKLLNGSGKLVMNNETVNLSEGDVFFIPKGCRYHSYWSVNEKNKLEWLSLGFKYFPDNSRGKLKTQKVVLSEEGERLLSEFLCNLDVTPKSVGRLYTVLEEMLGKMDREETRGDYLSENALRVMKENPLLSISEVAKETGISESRLYEAFKKSLGVTPNEMRQRILCEKAEELLKTTNLSVEEITGKLSFSSSSYLRKVLYAHTGKTPTEIRKENRI